MELVEKLRKYGDFHSHPDMDPKVLAKNLAFLERHGTTEDAEERGTIVKDLLTPTNYRTIMVEPIGALRLRKEREDRKNRRKEHIGELLKLGYKEKYLRKKRYESIEKMRNDPKLYEKYGKKEIGNVLVSEYGLSRSTVRSWSFGKARDFIQKDLLRNYSALCAKKNKKNIRGYLSGLTNCLFYDIVHDSVKE